MGLGRKKSADPAPADPNVQSQPDGSSAIATKRRLSITLPELYPFFLVLVGLFVLTLLSLIWQAVSGASTQSVTLTVYMALAIGAIAAIVGVTNLVRGE